MYSDPGDSRRRGAVSGNSNKRNNDNDNGAGHMTTSSKPKLPLGRLRAACKLKPCNIMYHTTYNRKEIVFFIKKPSL